MATIEAAKEEPTLASTEASGEAAEFVARFAEVWAAPTTERLNALLHSDVRLVQPMEPVIEGIESATALWDRLFELIPDITGEVRSWSGAGNLLFIELSMGGKFAGRPIEWVTVDRIRLEDGRVRERTAYFDPLPLIRAIALNPRGQAAWLKAKVSQRIGL